MRQAIVRDADDAPMPATLYTAIVSEGLIQSTRAALRSMLTGSTSTSRSRSRRKAGAERTCTRRDRYFFEVAFDFAFDPAFFFAAGVVGTTCPLRAAACFG